MDTPERATVAICSELVTDVFFDVNCTATGVNVHVACVGRFEHDRFTVPLNPFTAFTVSTTVVKPPAVTVADEGLAVTLKLGTVEVVAGLTAANGADTDAEKSDVAG